MFLSLSLSLNAQGQIPFVQVSQTPLLLNPGLAGSREKNRISFAINRHSESLKNSLNGYISYDKVAKKIGSGIGGYYAFSNNQSDTAYLSERERYSRKSSKFSIKNQNHIIGLAIAPKYNLFGPKQKIRYSFSPSLGLEYKYTHFSQKTDYKSYYHLTFNPDYPQGIRDDDSISYKIQDFRTHNLKFSLGLQFNSSKTLILYKTSYNLEMVRGKDQLSFIDLSNGANNKSSKHFTDIYSQSSLIHCFSLGRSFNIKNGAVTLSLLGGIGAIQYFHSPPSNIYNSFHEINKKTIKVNYIQASAILKVYRLLFGAGYTGGPYQDLGGLIVGYQGDSIKISAVLRSGNEFKTLFTELAVTYLF